MIDSRDQKSQKRNHTHKTSEWLTPAYSYCPAHFHRLALFFLISAHRFMSQMSVK